MIPLTFRFFYVITENSHSSHGLQFCANPLNLHNMSEHKSAPSRPKIGPYTANKFHDLQIRPRGIALFVMNVTIEGRRQPSRFVDDPRRSSM